MKKIFLFLAMIAMIASVTVSCKKDDKKDPKDVAQLLSSGDWMGYVSGYKKNNSQWDFNNERNYAVVYFKRTAANATYGTGHQREYKNEHMNEQTGYAEFSWNVTDEQIRISYSTEGWSDVFIKLDDCDINNSQFKGDMYDYNDHKYVFDFNKQ